METLNFDALVSMSNAIAANKKINRNNADQEFLNFYCYQVAKKMLPENSLKDPVSRDLAVKIYAKELAKQLKKEINITEVAKK